MAKVLVLYYSMYGHIETMANVVAEGARKVAGVEVTVKRIPETMNAEAFQGAGGKTDQVAAVATPAELGESSTESLNSRFMGTSPNNFPSIRMKQILLSFCQAT